MIPFMVFILASTFIVTLLFTTATPDAALTNMTYLNYLIHVYRLDFGDFTLDHYSDLDRAIFILAVIIVPLVFLNMLIAIMGDTYDRVTEQQDTLYFRVTVQLLYRSEAILVTFCKCDRSKRGVWKYIFLSEDVKYSGEEVLDIWQGRIRGIKMEIERLLKKQEEWQNKNERENQSLHREI